MKIILIEDIDSLGQSGDVIEVKDGYARNYLIPRGAARPATPGNIQLAERLKQQKQTRLEREKKEVEEFAAKISSVSCTISVKVGHDDKLYGAVTAAHIADALKREGIEVDKRNVVLEEPIKNLGVYTISIHLRPDVTAKVKVWVVKE
ncbi:MAG: 50S ribosomal protein L9 [Candidatus Omnitrophica bacterium]|nr:50S ribosomal protein L9 [Candidatus Omnitrophota bacterium]